MDILKTTVALLALATSPAFAKAADWHWNEYGASSYSGQVALRDDQGASVTYQRYSAGSTPALFGAVSVQSPLMVVAGNDINFDIVYSGQAVNKPTCNAPETPRVFVSPVTVCNFGQGNAMHGPIRTPLSTSRAWQSGFRVITGEPWTGLNAVASKSRRSASKWLPRSSNKRSSTTHLISMGWSSPLQERVSPGRWSST